MKLQPEADSDWDFSDLDAIVAEDEARRAAQKALAANAKLLQSKRLSDDERIVLTAQLRKAEDTFVWSTVAAVALFHSQTCTSCGHKHRFFMGWMTAQQHKTDPHCRRLLRGMPIEPAERRVEEHSQPDVELCSDCAEATILYLAIVDKVYPASEASRSGVTQDA